MVGANVVPSRLAGRPARAFAGVGPGARVPEGRRGAEARDAVRSLRRGGVRIHLDRHPRLRPLRRQWPTERAQGSRRAAQEDRRRGSPSMIALAIAAPPSSHFIFIPVVLLLGIVIGFMMGSRATRDAFRLEPRKAAERA